MAPKGRRITRSSQITTVAADDKEPVQTKSKSLKTRQKKPNSQAEVTVPDTGLNTAAPSHATSTASSVKKTDEKEPVCPKITCSTSKGLLTTSQDHSSVQGSRRKSSKCETIATSSHKKSIDSFAQPSCNKKRRFDSGDSFSAELHCMTSVSDSGFDTESSRSATSPAFETLLESSNKEEELNIDFSEPEQVILVDESSNGRHLWPNLHNKSQNIHHYLCKRSLGRLSSVTRNVITDNHAVSPVADFEISAHDKPFGARITTIDWHPRRQNFFCASSKHGDLNFYQIHSDDTRKLDIRRTYHGIGPGGYISAFKFHPADNERFYTSTLEGKVVLGNTIRGGDHVEKTLLSTGTWDFWYCAMDVSPVEDFVIAGRNNGMTAMCTTSGQPIWELRLHSKKITHLELSPREPHVLCTASLDHSVRLWDLRMLREVKGKIRPVEELGHEKGVNSAYFSLTDGTRLLTTDQHDQIRVYQAPFWHLETTILHPHRFFRHLTPHKAFWHPLVDKIVVGRYPGDWSLPEYGTERTIDIFDAVTGKLQYELKDPGFNGLVSLCKFNNTGDMLLSTMGYQINIWSKHLEDDMEDGGLKKSSHDRGGSELIPDRPTSIRQRKQKSEKELFKMKMTKMKTEKKVT